VDNLDLNPNLDLNLKIDLALAALLRVEVSFTPTFKTLSPKP